jgi:hypothetical protein
MSNCVWVGESSADWNTASNWKVGSSFATAPSRPNDNVNIVSSGATITITDSGSPQSAPMSVTGPADLDGSFYTGNFTASGVVQVQRTLTDSSGATFAKDATLEGGVTSVQGQAKKGCGHDSPAGRVRK